MKNNNGELKVCVPDDIDKIKRTIKALKSIIKTDINDFDKKIHKFKKIFKPIENTRFKVCANCRNNSIYL